MNFLGLNRVGNLGENEEKDATLVAREELDELVTRRLGLRSGGLQFRHGRPVKEDRVT